MRTAHRQAARAKRDVLRGDGRIISFDARPNFGCFDESSVHVAQNDTTSKHVAEIEVLRQVSDNGDAE